MPVTKKPGIAAVEEFQDLRFPLAGLDVVQAYDRQPNRPMPDGSYARTTPLMTNCRVYEPTSGRGRGGSRHGLAKYVSSQVNGGASIQCLDEVIVTAGIVPGSAPQLPHGVQTRDTGILTKPLDVLLAVGGGNVNVYVANESSWQLVGNGANALSNSAPVVRSTLINPYLYLFDGQGYGGSWRRYNATSNTVEFFTASAGSTLPVDSGGFGPRLCCTWRGRLFVAGWPYDPRNWAASKVGDGTNFQYAPTTAIAGVVASFIDPAGAIIGSAHPMGLIPDVVTCLIPYSDDVLIIGGAHSIWLMKGDPMDGGRLERLSDTIGIAWGTPYCRDPYGTVFFVSNLMGIYSMLPDGSQPTRASQPIEPLLAGQNLNNLIINGVWDDAAQAAHFFNTTFSAATSTDSHFTWEQRTGAWSQLTFANANHNPKVVKTFAGDSPTDRVVLLGSWDGYVRSISQSAATDDGTSIASSVLIGPLLTKDLDEVLVKDLQTILSKTSGQVSFAVYTGATAEIALSNTPMVTGTWSAGRNLTTYVRAAGHAIYVKITSTNSWAMETIRCRIAALGKVRRRGV